MIRNGLALAKLHEIDGDALSFAGTVALFVVSRHGVDEPETLELAALALPMFVILVLQASR